LGIYSLCEQAELHAGLAEIVKHGYQVAQAATEAVEFPDDCVTCPEIFLATEKGRAICGRALIALRP
jgi:ribosomal protein S27AE